MKYKFKTRPFKHQVRALKKLLRNEYGGALLMDPRTGKSKVFIDFACILFMKKKIDRVFIACPPKAIELKVWQEQWELHSPLPYDMFVWDRAAREGGRKGLPEPCTGRLLVVLVNYEAFAMPGKKLESGKRSTKTGRIRVRNEVRRWAKAGKTLAGLDESHAIKSTGAATHRMAVSLHSVFPYRIILTGTVVTKQSRPHDVYAQWRFLNPSRFDYWETVTDFKNYFGIWRRTANVPVPIFVKPRQSRLHELHELMMLDSFSQERDKCFDLPPIDRQIVPVELARAAKAYDQMAKNMVAEIRQYTAEAPIPLVKILRLAQITGGFVTTDQKKIIRVGTEKLDMLAPLIATYLENGERFAITARFKPELDAITRLAKSFKVPVFSIRGGLNKNQQYTDFKRARTLAEPFIYVLQPQAAAEAIDLSFLSRMVWYSLTNYFVKYTQCCDRIALSRVSTTFTYLLTSGIDTMMYEELQGDGQFLKAVRNHPERLLRE